MGVREGGKREGEREGGKEGENEGGLGILSHLPNQDTFFSKVSALERFPG